jgi:hypothetical protein
MLQNEPEVKQPQSAQQGGQQGGQQYAQEQQQQQQQQVERLQGESAFQHMQRLVKMGRSSSDAAREVKPPVSLKKRFNACSISGNNVMTPAVPF